MRKRPPLLRFAAWIFVLIVGISRQTIWSIHKIERKGYEQETALLSSLEQRAGAHDARFLLGIFTTMEEHETRQMIRRALHSYNDDRVCSFGSMNGRMAPRPRDNCKLIFTFVVGANPLGTPQIVNNGRKDLLTLPPGAIKTAREPNDMTFLNIKENNNEGKTPTWFHYAYEAMTAYNLDYAIKSDSTTKLLVDKFFQMSKNNLPRGGALVYAGKLGWSTRHNHIYMGGAFYLLSRQLAHLVSTVSLRAHHGVLYQEDIDVGWIISQSNELLHVVALHNLNGMFPWRNYNETNKVDG